MSRLSVFSRRRFLAALGATAVAVPVLAACQPATPTPQPKATAAPAAATKPAVAPTPAPAKAVNLVFWRYPSTVQDKAVQDFMDGFMKQNPGVTFEVASYGPMAEYRQKILAALAAKTAPDLMFADGPWLPEFASRQILDPAPPDVTEDLKTNFTAGGQAYVSYKGTYYAYPWETSVHQAYLNDNFYKEAGLDPKNPPFKSYAEFREGMKKLAKVEGGQTTRAGFLANRRLMYFSNFLYNNGAVLINEDSQGNVTEPKVTFDSPAAMECWELWYNLYNVDKSANAKLPVHTDAFPQGVCATVVSGNFFIDTLKANAPTLAYSIAGQPYNKGKSLAQLGGWMCSVNRETAADKKPICWKYYKYINTKESILESLGKFVWLTTHKAAMADPKAIVLNPEKLKPFYEVLPNISHVRPKSTAYQQIESACDPIIDKLCLGEFKPDQAVSEAKKAVDAFLKEATK